MKAGHQKKEKNPCILETDEKVASKVLIWPSCCLAIWCWSLTFSPQNLISSSLFSTALQCSCNLKFCEIRTNGL